MERYNYRVSPWPPDSPRPALALAAMAYTVLPALTVALALTVTGISNRAVLVGVPGVLVTGAGVVVFATGGRPVLNHLLPLVSLLAAGGAPPGAEPPGGAGRTCEDESSIAPPPFSSLSLRVRQGRHTPTQATPSEALTRADQS